MLNCVPLVSRKVPQTSIYPKHSSNSTGQVLKFSLLEGWWQLHIPSKTFAAWAMSGLSHQAKFLPASVCLISFPQVPYIWGSKVCLFPLPLSSPSLLSGEKMKRCDQSCACEQEVEAGWMLKIHTHTHTDKQTDRHPTPGMTQARAKLRGPLCAAGGKRLCPDPVTGA
jgi:hypothetical protein